MSTPQRLSAPIWMILMARLAAVVAVSTQVTMVGKQVYDLTGSEFALGLLGLAEFGPTALLSPVTGALADRYDRRYVVWAGSAGLLISALLLFVYARMEPTSVMPIYVFTIVFGAARSLSAPSLRVMPIDLAPAELVERVVALGTMFAQLGVILGPIVGAFLYVAHPSWPFAFAAALFALSALMVTGAPDSGVQRTTGAMSPRRALRDARDGLRYIRTNETLFGAISLDLMAVLFGGAVALLPAIAEERLHVGTVGFGWLRAGMGLGAAVVSALIAAVPIRRHVGAVLYASILVFGLATITLGLTRSYVVAFVAVVVLAGSDAVSMFIRGAVVPLATPESMRGRVLATENVFIGASNELGAFESGITSAIMGLVGAVVFGGAATVAVVGIWWFMFPSLRRIDRFADARIVEAN